jgi:hypothetical protein
MHDHDRRCAGQPRALPDPPEPPIYKTTKTGGQVALTVITGGVWGLFVWWPLHEAVKAQNKRKRIRYAAAMSAYWHAGTASVE